MTIIQIGLGIVWEKLHQYQYAKSDPDTNRVLNLIFSAC